MSASLLVELLTEELPPKALRAMGYAFADALVQSLRQDGFAPPDGEFAVYASPRRLGVRVRHVVDKAPDREALVKGPSIKAGLAADGSPTAALVGFAKKQGVPVDKLERVQDGKQEVFAFRSRVPGMSLDATLSAKVDAALGKLPIPKVMRWGDFDAEFVRPARGLVLLHGERVVPGRVLGLESGRTTLGHRFMSHGEIVLKGADDYDRALEHEGRVIANFELRGRAIRERLAEAAGGATIAADDALFDEVTALVEWPAVYEAHFEKAFLAVPQECLMLTMKQNQKYFPLVDGQGRLSNRFLLVSNMAVAHPHHIVHGNERVLRARLADARFFYDQDRREPLAARVPRLANVVYHNQLGSQRERVQRIEHLAETIAARLGADTTQAKRAAYLAKADLLTGMVGEFPELQGVMGAYYARHDGETDAVARAIEAHYRPRFAGDALPEDAIGDAVALADKLDTLVGIWSIGGAPTGDKDPFALRRAALGVVRILAEHGLPLDLLELLQASAARHARPGIEKVPAEVHAFALERLRSYLRERDFAVDEIEAVLAEQPRRIDLVLPRLEAVRSFRRLPEAEALAAANKRIGNILKKAEAVGDAVDPASLVESEEKKLFATLAQLQPEVETQLESGRFAAALKSLAGLRGDVDAFFDRVLVNAEDPRVRANRLALLSRLARLMNRVADISKLAG
ncbi:MAG: glycine--tRNA ligase subunit beta [Burkholderiales bacterium]